MARLNVVGVVSLGLLLPSTLALPHFWPHGYNVKPYPTLTITSSEGVYPTGISGTTGTGTGTGTGTAYYPTATGSAYIVKRDPDHPYGYPPPYKPSTTSSIVPSGQPTGISPPIGPTVIPTGTAPSASGTGTGMLYPTHVPEKREVEAAHRAHRQHFEGPRKRELKPYYPYEPSYDGGVGSTATAPTGPTGSGVIPTGTSVVPLPVPTGTVIIPQPMPTGGTGTVSLPTISGTVGGGYSTMVA